MKQVRRAYFVTCKTFRILVLENERKVAYFHYPELAVMCSKVSKKMINLWGKNRWPGKCHTGDYERKNKMNLE